MQTNTAAVQQPSKSIEEIVQDFESQAVGLADAAILLNRHVGSVKNYIGTGKLTGAKTTGGKIWIARSEIDSMIAKRTR